MTAEEILSRIPQYQGLIFDLDGTLVDSMPWHVAAWQQVCREHGFISVSLGKRILRTETASLAMLSILMYEKEAL